MRTSILVSLLAFLLVMGQACSDDRPATESAPANIHFVADSTEVSWGRCDTFGMGPCAHVRLVWLRATGAPEAVARRINDTLAQYQHYELFADSASAPPQTVADEARAFIRTFQQYAEPDMPERWDLETIASLDYETDKVWSVAIRSYAYTGGAHPNSWVTLLVFAKSDGRKLEWQDIVRDRKGLEALVERMFRQARGLQADEPLAEAGFFQDGAFQLPQNFYVRPDGLYLYYNPYEIAPYALGPTEFLIDRQELEGLVRSELLW